MEPVQTFTAEAARNFSIRLDFFSGPMDLLLHLVSQREVPIAEVDMTEVCEQYLNIVNHAEFLDLERASEYLVIAATLMAIKSQALLPGEKVEEDTSGEDAFDSRFFEELRERLRAYEETKLRAIELTRLPQLGVDTFVRDEKIKIAPDLDLDHGDPRSLGTSFLHLLKRIGSKGESFRIKLEPISVVTFMMKILDRLRPEGQPAPRSFFQMVRTFASKRAEKGQMIGTFIGILELVKRGVVGVEQANDCADIELKLRVADAHPEEFTSEFDEAPDGKVVDMSAYRAPVVEEQVVEERKEANAG